MFEDLRREASAAEPDDQGPSDYGQAVVPPLAYGIEGQGNHEEHQAMG